MDFINAGAMDFLSKPYFKDRHYLTFSLKLTANQHFNTSTLQHFNT